MQRVDKLTFLHFVFRKSFVSSMICVELNYLPLDALQCIGTIVPIQSEYCDTVEKQKAGLG